MFQFIFLSFWSNLNFLFFNKTIEYHKILFCDDTLDDILKIEL